VLKVNDKNKLLFNIFFIIPNMSNLSDVINFTNTKDLLLFSTFIDLRDVHKTVSFFLETVEYCTIRSE